MIAVLGAVLCACAEPSPPPPSGPDPAPEGDGSEPQEVSSGDEGATDDEGALEGEGEGEESELLGELEEDDISEEELAALMDDAEPEVPWNDEQRERIAKVQPIVRAAALEHGVEPDLINAVIWVESKFAPRARGPAGARGMMQLMPKTSRGLAKRLGRKDRPYDPDFSIHAGTLYLARLMKRLDADESWALVAYNRGLGRALDDRDAGKSPEMSAEVFLGRVSRARAAVQASEFHLTLEELRGLEQLRSEGTLEAAGGKNVGSPPKD